MLQDYKIGENFRPWHAKKYPTHQRMSLYRDKHFSKYYIFSSLEYEKNENMNYFLEMILNIYMKYK